MDRLEEYLLNDRQWLRRDRIDHARYQLRNAQTEEDRKFYLEVIKANMTDVRRGK